MGRRKYGWTIFRSFQGNTPDEERFNEAVLGAHGSSTTLYAETTVYQVDCINGVFEEVNAERLIDAS